MQFGVCTSRNRVVAVHAAGGDYVELSVADDLAPGADQATWTALRREIEALPLPTPAFISFVRSGKIVGPEADFAYLAQYVDTALQRASEVGGKIIVFGSGGARRVPKGFPPEEAERQILRFLNLCADAYERTGVVVAIEPLNPGESNLINTVADGARLARLVNRPGVRNLADTYHMARQNEPLSEITAFADVLAHVHTADVDRRAPSEGRYDYRALFAVLHACDYAAKGDNARLSIECDWRDFDAEIGPSLGRLRADEAAVAAAAVNP